MNLALQININCCKSDKIITFYAGAKCGSSTLLKTLLSEKNILSGIESADLPVANFTHEKVNYIRKNKLQPFWDVLEPMYMEPPNNNIKIRLARDPYTRAVSCYFAMVRPNGTEWQQQFVKDAGAHISFERFLDFLIKNKDYTCTGIPSNDDHSKRTVDMHFQPQSHGDHLTYDKIIQIENISLWFKRINEEHGLNLKPRYNETHHLKEIVSNNEDYCGHRARDWHMDIPNGRPPIATFYNVENIEKVNEYYSNDFLKYGYRMIK